MRVNNLSKVAVDSAAAGIEPAISSRKSNARTSTPPSHTVREHNGQVEKMCALNFHIFVGVMPPDPCYKTGRGQTKMRVGDCVMAVGGNGRPCP